MFSQGKLHKFMDIQTDASNIRWSKTKENTQSIPLFLNSYQYDTPGLYTQ